MAHPIDVRVEYGDGKRNRGYALLGIVWYAKGLLLLPHLIVATLAAAVALFAAWVGYWAVALTGRQPLLLPRLHAGAIRWNVRAYAWLLGTVDAYPPFALADGDYAARTTVPAPPDHPSRLLAAGGIVGVKHLLVGPHLIVLAVVTPLAVVAAWVGFVLAGFNGTLPRPLHDSLVGLLRRHARVWGWLFGLTDDYPPFTLS